jgi:hypothetical protein
MEAMNRQLLKFYKPEELKSVREFNRHGKGVWEPGTLLVIKPTIGEPLKDRSSHVWKVDDHQVSSGVVGKRLGTETVAYHYVTDFAAVFIGDPETLK